jgi:hypothetical protein
MFLPIAIAHPAATKNRRQGYGSRLEVTGDCEALALDYTLMRAGWRLIPD